MNYCDTVCYLAYIHFMHSISFFKIQIHCPLFNPPPPKFGCGGAETVCAGGGLGQAVQAPLQGVGGHKAGSIFHSSISAAG